MPTSSPALFSSRVLENPAELNRRSPSHPHQIPGRQPRVLGWGPCNVIQCFCHAQTRGRASPSEYWVLRDTNHDRGMP